MAVGQRISSAQPLFREDMSSVILRTKDRASSGWNGGAVHVREERKEVPVEERGVQDHLVALVVGVESVHHAPQRTLEPPHVPGFAIRGSTPM